MTLWPDQELKCFLDDWVQRINTPAYIESDPVQFPLRYHNQQDVEIVAFLTATIAWGNRKTILRSAERMLGHMGSSPSDYILSGAYRNYPAGNIHRTFFSKDLVYLCNGFRAYYQRNDSLETLFASSGDMWDGISTLRKEMAEANLGESTRHLSNPEAGSACKRLHLALRWLVRNDGIVDAGCWSRISPAQLMIPLDVHVGRTSRLLGLLNRKQSDRKAVEELTQRLRALDSEDPVKYDYALFGIGESGVDLSDLLNRKSIDNLV